MDDVIGRQPEGITVIATYPDPSNNRIIAEVGSVNDTFLYRVAKQYGARALAIRLVKDKNVGAPGLAGERQ